MASTANRLDERDPRGCDESPPAADHATPLDRADRVHDAIERAGLTLYQVSSLTSRRGARRRGEAPVPHTLYRDVRAGQVPTLPQLAALSRTTGRPLAWWLRVFGVDVSVLASLQRRLHPGRTFVLPSRTFDPTTALPCWNRWSARRDVRHHQALEEGVDGQLPTTAWALDQASRRRFVYISVGDDKWRAAGIGAGSIVRIDPRRTRPRRFGRRHGIYAVAHADGLSCGYVDVLPGSHVAIFGASSQVTPLVRRLGSEAVILGRVDAELRFLAMPPAMVETRAARPPHAWAIALPDSRHDIFGRFVRRSRSCLGLTFRDAQALSNQVAARFGDNRFHLSLGALSNYETIETLPGSAHAVFCLAAVYAMDFWRVLQVGGIRGTHQATDEDSAASAASPWTRDVVRRMGELPVFLAPLLDDELGCGGGSGGAGPGVLDAEGWFLVGASQRCLDSRLEGALLVAIDRRDRKLAGQSEATAEPPLVMLRLDNDAHVCCVASLQGSSVVVHASPSLGAAPRILPRERVDIVGRVSAILRRVGG